ncbi:SNAP receptor complex protein [Ceratobasidium sp. AG-Ba]|nr:SNAP receptor complex protein [Ceratobasidium sp. AG-Ba]
MTTYESLRRQCRTLEALVNDKLTGYSRLAVTLSSGSDVEAGTSAARWSDMEEEIEGLLEKLKETNDGMADLMSDDAAAVTTSMRHSAQMHREVLDDYVRDFGRTKANVRAALDRANLLTNVRSDINAYKAARSSATDQLLAERGRIDSSHRMTDDVLAQAYETRAEFSRQRSSLAGINTRMKGVLNTMPGINSLIGMIHSRRRRDAIVLGVVIGLCFLGLLSYVGR